MGEVTARLGQQGPRSLRPIVASWPAATAGPTSPPVDDRIYNVYTRVRVDVAFHYRSERFAWDGAKAYRNVIKHGIRFEQACEVFFDPLARILDASSIDEQREAVIGLTAAGTTLYVVHMWRDDQGTRIISAREASTTERRTYEDHA